MLTAAVAVRPSFPKTVGSGRSIFFGTGREIVSVGISVIVSDSSTESDVVFCDFWRVDDGVGRRVGEIVSTRE